MRLPRLYPVLDTKALRARGCPATEAAEAMLDAGAKILQFRHKEHFTRDIFTAAERSAELCSHYNALFIVDDRADVAAMLHAGLHIGQDDIEPRRARPLVGSGRPLGFSAHNEDQLRGSEAEPVDYVALGPIFATASKTRPDPVVGLRELERLRPLTRRPLVAIGGITRGTALETIAAGADSVAVIGDLLPEPCTALAVCRRTEEWLRLLET